MTIKTTLNLKHSQAALLYKTASRFDISLSLIINSLAHKAFKSYNFPIRFLQSVKYQDKLNDECDSWKRVPVSFKGDVYEKCLDVRKVGKVSVSRIFSEAIVKYLDELILEFEGNKKSDNYTSNYIQLWTKIGDFSQITQIWDIVEPERLKKLQDLHHAPL